MKLHFEYDLDLTNVREPLSPKETAAAIKVIVYEIEQHVTSKAAKEVTRVVNLLQKQQTQTR